MKRILPKLIGVALIAGIAAFILSMIAKLLFAVAILGIAILFIKNRISRRMAAGPQQMPYGQSFNGMPYPQQFNTGNIVPVQGKQAVPGIIPIN